MVLFIRFRESSSVNRHSPSSWHTNKYFTNIIFRWLCVCVCVCVHARAHAQLYPTLCDSMDCSPPGSSVHGILQARILEWVAIPFSRGSSPPRDRSHVSCISCIGRQVLYDLCHLGSPFTWLGAAEHAGWREKRKVFNIFSTQGPLLLSTHNGRGQCGDREYAQKWAYHHQVKQVTSFPGLHFPAALSEMVGWDDVWDIFSPWLTELRTPY